jgi:FPC/CPF motif-containing protein YcgG
MLIRETLPSRLLTPSCGVRHRVIAREWKRYLERADDHQTVGSVPVRVLANSSEEEGERV